MNLSDLPSDLLEEVVNNLPDREIIKFVLRYRRNLYFKPRLHNFYFPVQLSQIEQKIQDYWKLDNPISITDLFFLDGIVYDGNLPDKYKNTRIPLVVDLDNKSDLTNPFISRFVTFNGRKTDLMTNSMNLIDDRQILDRSFNFKTYGPLESIMDLFNFKI